MNFIQKLEEQSQFEGVLLFKEGVFLRAYNQGVYILTELLGYPFKVRVIKLKTLKNKSITTCAFPLNTLAKRLSNANLTELGVSYPYAYNHESYSLWFQRHCHEESFANEKAIASSEPLKMRDRRASALAIKKCTIEKNTNSIYIKLNQKQINYLSNWQQGCYSLEVDYKFIQSLKNKLNFRTKNGDIDY